MLERYLQRFQATQSDRGDYTGLQGDFSPAGKVSARKALSADRKPLEDVVLYIEDVQAVWYAPVGHGKSDKDFNNRKSVKGVLRRNGAGKGTDTAR